jgi:hypothetical protein
MMIRYLLALFTVLIFFQPINAQIKPNESELITGTKKHSAKRATIYSAILPGSGQAYNKKYWKIPLVYAGIGTISYFIVSNHKHYVEAREAYDYVSNEYEYPIDNELVDKYDEADLLEIRDYYRRNVELSWIVMGLWYILNIIDANVDAHFFDYDISDNLSMRIQPIIDPFVLNGKSHVNQFQAGIGISVKF